MRASDGDTIHITSSSLSVQNVMSICHQWKQTAVHPNG
jgi:hypothetical protein